MYLCIAKEKQIMEQFIHIVCGMAPYLLLGFFLSGLMHSFIPGRFYGRYLSSGKFSSVLYATLFGIPLPLCSCGVIPTAMSLRKEGASRGAVVSFLIATPQTGVDSIIATYGLMGLPFAIVRPLAALFTAIFGGSLALLGDKGAKQEERCEAKQEVEHKTFTVRFREAMHYGFVEMMQDIGRWLVLGLVVAAVITICVPDEWFTILNGNTFASMLLVLLIAIPMYVCATGSIPVAVALMMKGLTPGAALVLLMAGPACNLASILVVRKVLGIKTMLIYMASIIVGAIAFGSIVDYLQFNHIVDFLSQLVTTPACCMASNTWLEIGSGVLLLLLLFNALIVQRFKKKETSNKINKETMKVYHIEGMNCNHCRASVEKAILGVEGVTSASVNLQTKEAQVEGTATFEQISKAVDEVGFKCTL